MAKQFIDLFMFLFYRLNSLLEPNIEHEKLILNEERNISISSMSYHLIDISSQRIIINTSLYFEGQHRDHLVDLVGCYA